MNIRLLAFLVVLTLLRFVYIGQVELAPDEAYYHEWSQRLDLCYFSKGPGIALTMWAGTALFGHGEFGIRFFAPVLALGTSLLIYWLARRLYDARIATWTVVAINATPIFNAGGLLMTIDPLSIFFWTATLCTLWLALEKSPAFSMWWPLSGVLTGIGFLCKWTNAVLLLSLLLLLLLTPRFRRELLRPGFYTALACALPALIPVWMWQEPNGWPLLNHLSARGGLEKPWWQIDWAAFGQFIGAHLGVYSPLIFAAMLVALWMTVRDSASRWCAAIPRALVAIPRGIARHWLPVTAVVITSFACWLLGNFFDEPLLHKLTVLIPVLALLTGLASCRAAANMHWKSRFLAAFTVPLVLGYTWIALHHDSEPNWTAPAAVTLIILTVAWWIDRVQSGTPRKLAISALALGAAITLIALNTDLIRSIGIPWPLTKDPSARLRGWRETARVIGETRALYETKLNAARAVAGQEKEEVFLIAENYGLAAALCYYLPEKRALLPGHPQVYVPESPVAANQFHFWGRYDEFEQRTALVINKDEDSSERGVSRFAGRTALYITTRDKPKPPGVLMDTFDRWELATQFELKQGDFPLRTIRVFILHRYLPGRLLD